MTSISCLSLFGVLAFIGLLGLFLLACWDRLQSQEPTYRVYPVIGRLVSFLRHVVSVLYLDALPAAPFTPRELRQIRSRALTGSNLTAFGTSRLSGYATRPASEVVLIPSEPTRHFALAVGGSLGSRAVEVPILNFGALGLGPVNDRVVRAFGLAAKSVECLHNTGEDGLTSVHSESGARLIWQIGTGYWGCRDDSGKFSPESFQNRLKTFPVSLIELKISQGAKPGAGGLLPARKNPPRVARLLGVEANTDVISPATHSAFSNIAEMLAFLRDLATLSSGLPIGFKLCLGSRRTLKELVSTMEKEDAVPDFITIDGAEGGTGAAPSDLQDFAGLPLRQGIKELHDVLVTAGLRERTRLFASGGLKTGFDLFELLCLGADGAFFTRAPMVAIGCVQARECHLNTCPAGIATQGLWRRTAIHPHSQGRQLARYYATVQQDFWELLRAAGVRSPADLGPDLLLEATPKIGGS